ncbi:hypothetical protein GCM10023093_15850 [Nemorincola caseinilytica]|uniref:Glycosyltransferase RgtA/B/C/D-like domain-containing protein n=2 Tax=Nemorincola caseinilytica TaxID=2054315 RepID=A0ABP8NC13_9BACT
MFLFIAADGLLLVRLHPSSIHIFRQSDCLAYTLRYYRDDSGFFSPACFNLIGKDGRVVSEFPILYYISAKLCQLLGFHFWVVRGLTVLCYAIGLVYLFLCIRLWIKDVIVSLFPIIILATSPCFFFYAVNYLPNVPAISLSFAGLYYMLRYGYTRSILHLIAATTLFTLTVLLKPTDGGIVWLAFITSMHTISPAGSYRPRWPVWVSVSIISAAALSWYLFVHYYNLRYDNDINLQGIYPIWHMTGREILATLWYRIIKLGPQVFHHTALLLLLAGMLVFYIIRWSQLHPFLRRFTLMLILLSLAYSVLWFKAFYVHDYYQLLFSIPAVFLCITVSEYYCRIAVMHLPPYASHVVSLTLITCMVGSIYYNQYIQQCRQADLGYPDIDVIYEAGAHLSRLGLCPTDRVLSVPDGSPNISLAALGLCGYTSDLFNPGRFDVHYAVANGVRYMVLLDSSYIHHPAYAPYTTRLVGRYRHITVYDLWQAPAVMQNLAAGRYDTATPAGKMFTQWRTYRGM